MWKLLAEVCHETECVVIQYQFRFKCRLAVASGWRPECQPAVVQAKPELIALARDCWEQDHGERPTFRDIVVRLGQAAESRRHVPALKCHATRDYLVAIYCAASKKVWFRPFR